MCNYSLQFPKICGKVSSSSSPSSEDRCFLGAALPQAAPRIHNQNLTVNSVYGETGLSFEPEIPTCSACTAQVHRTNAHKVECAALTRRPVQVRGHSLQKSVGDSAGARVLVQRLLCNEVPVPFSSRLASAGGGASGRRRALTSFPGAEQTRGDGGEPASWLSAWTAPGLPARPSFRLSGSATQDVGSQLEV
jgi:hypothetical protein